MIKEQVYCLLIIVLLLIASMAFAYFIPSKRKNTGYSVNGDYIYYDSSMDDHSDTKSSSYD